MQITASFLLLSFFKTKIGAKTANPTKIPKVLRF